MGDLGPGRLEGLGHTRRPREEVESGARLRPFEHLPEDGDEAALGTEVLDHGVTGITVSPAPSGDGPPRRRSPGRNRRTTG